MSMLIQLSKKETIQDKGSTCVLMTAGLFSRILNLFAEICARQQWEVVQKQDYFILFKEITQLKLLLNVCLELLNFHPDGYLTMECLLV